MIIAFLQLRFIPRNVHIALLALRLWLGLSMVLIHGLGKLKQFSEMAPKFPDPLGIGHPASLGLAVFAEVGCSVLIILGLFTRLASLGLAINMSVAFFVVHQASLAGEKSGELAFIYLAGYVTLLIAGGGVFSLDSAAHEPPLKTK
jgi:putative oxidoreductase